MDLHWRRLESLKIMVVKNACFSRGPNALPKGLRVLKWYGYPESSLPAHFVAKKLVFEFLHIQEFTDHGGNTVADLS